jgi:hypothetical protein
MRGRTWDKIVVRGVASMAVSVLYVAGATGVCFAARNVNVTSTLPGNVTGTGVCTLEEAVGAMNVGTSQNGCTVSGTGEPRTVTLNLAGTNAYKISARLAPTVAMTIRGLGPGSMGNTFIEPTSSFTANAAVYHRVLTTTPFDVTLQDVTIRRTSGSATVTGIRVENFWNGSNLGPQMILNRVRVSGFNNSGVYSTYGNVVITDSIIENNSTSSDGGGIFHFADGSSQRALRVLRSLIKGNVASGAGGGIYFLGGGNSRVDNTTIAQNSAQSGGGVFSQMDNGYLEFHYSTIAENDAFSGGGIYCNACDHRTFTYFSVIAYNTGAQGFDLDGDLSSTASLWSFTDSLDQSSHDAEDLVNVDPLLGNLKDLGGNIADLNADGVLDGMQGYQPIKGSPALDRLIPQPSAEPRDQRGYLRSYDSNGLGTGNNDMGAFEQGPWEAELISRFALSGGTHVVLPTSGTDTNFSDGKAMRFRATADNQYVTYRLPISQTGSYAIEVKVRKGASGAQARLQWSPNGSTSWANLGPIQEFYSTGTLDQHLDFNATLSPIGQIYFRWFVTGKNTASNNRDVITDYIKLMKQ